MLAESKGSSTSEVFYNSHLGSDFHQVYKNNMDDKSFVGSSKVIDGILTNPNTAFFGTELYFDDTKEYQNCQVFRINFSFFTTNDLNLSKSDTKDLVSQFGKFVNWIHKGVALWNIYEARII